MCTSSAALKKWSAFEIRLVPSNNGENGELSVLIKGENNDFVASNMQVWRITALVQPEQL